MDIMHLGQPAAGPIMLETLSEYPRIFRLHNFFSEYEADTLMADAIEEFQANPPLPKQQPFRPTDTDDELLVNADEFVARSYSGHDHPLEPMTGDRIDLSKQAILLKSDVAFRMRRRVLDLLGVFPYDDTYTEGWQVMRYNESQGYDIHQDWIEPSFLASHDYNSAYEGTNRFIAIYFYLQTPMEGGETVFPLLDPTPHQIREQYFRNEVMRYREMAQKLKSEFKAKKEKEEELARLQQRVGVSELADAANIFEENLLRRTVCKPKSSIDGTDRKKTTKKRKKNSAKRDSAFDDTAVLDVQDEVCSHISKIFCVINPILFLLSIMIRFVKKCSSMRIQEKLWTTHNLPNERKQTFCPKTHSEIV